MKTEIVEYPFHSKSYHILLGKKEYYCRQHNRYFNLEAPAHVKDDIDQDYLSMYDVDLIENRIFNYQIIKPAHKLIAEEVIFLFHGFNEKDWQKYLPWARTICENTGKSVILFPIAFHMQRTPKLWSSKREMYKLSEKRKNKYPDINESSLSNVAISIRIEDMPERFIWSGLQTYYDVIQLVEEGKAGLHDYLGRETKFDFFAYSIGGFLALTLKMANYQDYFSKTKVCLFCSGTTLNRMRPVSKYILDSKANEAMYSYLIDKIEDNLRENARLYHYLEEGHLEGRILKSLLDDTKLREFREDLLRKYEKQIYAISLKRDFVIPSQAVTTILNGERKRNNIRVEELDYVRNYTHENPFSNLDFPQVKADFDFTFNKIRKFFCQ